MSPGIHAGTSQTMDEICGTVTLNSNKNCSDKYNIKMLLLRVNI